MRLIYVAHTFGGLQANADAAEQWCAQLSLIFDAVFFVPWIPLVRHWIDSGQTRERGLVLDLEAVKRSDEVWFICERQGVLSDDQQMVETEAVQHGIARRYFEKELLEGITTKYPTETCRAMREALRKKLKEPLAIGSRQEQTPGFGLQAPKEQPDNQQPTSDKMSSD